MSKGGFAGIGRKKKVENAFIEGAKVDGQSSVFAGLDPKARRGSKYKDPDKNQVVKLDGKVQGIPLNGYEVALLEAAAAKTGLSLTAYIRGAAIAKANSILGV